jgi:hypothetical protein
MWVQITPNKNKLEKAVFSHQDFRKFKNAPLLPLLKLHQ